MYNAMPRRPRLAPLAIAASTVAAGSLIAVTTQSAQAASAPDDLRASYVSTKGVGLRWDEAGEDAYRVRFATSSNMRSNKDTWDVIGNEYEWLRMNGNPDSNAARLKPGGTYYFQVKSIDRDDRSDISGYSDAIKVTLPKSGSPELKPVNLKATPAGPDSMYVSWSSRGPGAHYILRYTSEPSKSVTKWAKVTMDAAGGKVTGLKKDTKYYFRSRVYDPTTGKGLSSYSKSGDYGITTSEATSAQVSLVSYNVHKASGSPSWSKRRKPVAAMILSENPDVVALQEATPLRYKGVKQYDDLVHLLGKSYELTTRRGSSGSKLVYNTSTLKVIDTDVKALTTLGSATRYAVWAIFEDKRTDERFFVVNTHLEPGGQTSAAANDARIVQAREILDVIKEESKDLPVLIAGDMNSSRAAKPANGQYEVFTGAGFIDPTDNPTYSWASGVDSDVEHPIDWEYSTANSYASRARRTSFPVGTNIDYIYTSPDVRIGTWRTVVKIDSDRRFIGTLPSDHNMLAVNVNVK